MNSGDGMLTSLLLGRAPYLLVYVGCLVYALAQIGRHRSAATLAAGACAVLFLNSVVGAIVQAGLQSDRMRDGTPMAEYAAKMASFGLVTSIVGTAGFVALFAAVFVGRGAAPVGHAAYDPRVPPPGG